MGMQVEFRTRRSEKGASINLAPNEERFLGNSGDIVLTGGDVRARHARIFRQGQGLHIEPIDQAPLAINGKPVTRSTLLANGDWLACGSAFLQIKIASSDLQTPPSGTAAGQLRNRVISIGRLETCDLSIPSPLVSRNHANLHYESGKAVIQDLNSTNGTFINGKRASGPVALQRGDKVGIAAFTYVFTGDALEPFDATGLVHLEVRDLCKEVRDRSTGKPKRLLDNINLVIEPGDFVAIFGTSGSGKSTLLDALNGRRPASFGQVLYNGIDFYQTYDSFRAAIGYVPQQDIVHRKISVQRALKYTARLRLPPDTSQEEIGSHIERVLKQVGLGDKGSSPIDTPSPLSGGQLKRVSLAVELIANPNILFLDEVTSGLDAGTDKKMMRLFADLAADQRTVICVTHTLENIDICHLVVLLHRGKLIFFGPPRDALHHFGVSRLADVYELIESRPAEHWADKYLHSPYHDAYIRKRASASPSVEHEQQAETVTPVRTEKSRFRWSQLGTLMRRYVDLLQADRRNLAILLLQAPLVAIMIGLVFDTSGPLPARASAESQISFMLVLSAIWCGCLNSTREVVKELPIYLRERAVNLGIAPYLLSKLVPLAVLCALQSLALVGIASLLLHWSGDFWTRLLILFLSAMGATGMGLAISTFVDSNDKAVTLIPILLIPQVIFSGAIVTLGKTGEIIARLTIIAYSAFDAMKTTMASEVASLLPSPATWSLSSNLSMIFALFLVFSLAAFLGLKLKDLRR
jgi:ABC transport system ATP-binding/permease protein